MLSYYIEELRIIILDDSQYFLWQIKQTNKKNFGSSTLTNKQTKKLLKMLNLCLAKH